MEPLDNENTLRQAVWEIVQAIPAVDVCARIAGPDGALRSGPDAMTADPDLLALARAVRPGVVPPAPDVVWDALFRERAPLAEAARGLWGALTDFGVPADANRWDSWRLAWSSSGPALWLNRALAAAGLRQVFVPVDPVATCSAHALPADERLRPLLDLDALVHRWQRVRLRLARFGYAVQERPDPNTYSEARRFLDAACDRWRPAGMVVRIPGGFRFDRSAAARILEQVALPVVRDRRLPLILALDEVPSLSSGPGEFPVPVSATPTVASGVVAAADLQAALAAAPVPEVEGSLVEGTKSALFRMAAPGAAEAALPSAGGMASEADWAADRVDPVETRWVEEWLAAWPGVRFVLSAAAWESQAALTRLARGRSGVTVFGGAGPMLEGSRMAYRTRLEVLGTRCLLGGGAAYTLEGLVSAWRRTRWLAAVALQDRYCDLLRVGWTVARTDIEREAAALLGGGFPYPEES